MMRLKASLRGVIGNRRGNVAVLFSVAIAPLLAVAALAAIYASISGQKAKLQNAADAGALQAAKELRLAQIGTSNNVISLAKT